MLFIRTNSVLSGTLYFVTFLESNVAFSYDFKVSDLMTRDNNSQTGLVKLVQRIR